MPLCCRRDAVTRYFDSATFSALPLLRAFYLHDGGFSRYVDTRDIDARAPLRFARYYDMIARCVERAAR